MRIKDIVPPKSHSSKYGFAVFEVLERSISQANYCWSNFKLPDREAVKITYNLLRGLHYLHTSEPPAYGLTPPPPPPMPSLTQHPPAMQPSLGVGEKPGGGGGGEFSRRIRGAVIFACGHTDAGKGNDTSLRERK